MGAQETFAVGDRVIKTGFRWMREPDRCGEVVEVYRSTKNGRGESDTFYGVRWDNGQITRGHLAVGLEKFIPLPPILLPGVK